MTPQSARVPLVTVNINGREYKGFITLPWYQYLNREIPAESQGGSTSRSPISFNIGIGVGGTQEQSSQPFVIPGPRGAQGPRGATGILWTERVTQAAAPMLPAVSARSGLYTPTLTNVTNLDGSTAYACQYTVTGRVATVSGMVDVDPTAAAAARLGMSLPVPSDFATSQQCGGVAFASNGQGAAISADTANNRADFNFTAIGTANISMQFVFQYQII